jgi:hypothetical protein
MFTEGFYIIKVMFFLTHGNGEVRGNRYWGTD